MRRPNRRSFLKGAAVSGAAALGANPQAARAQESRPARAASAPSAAAREAETGAPAAEVLTADRPGADFMTDVLKSLGFEYLCANPGSSFRGLHESIVNYGGNRSPEFITCWISSASRRWISQSPPMRKRRYRHSPKR
ncbi:MAG: twin-arginine translocation signal domain-containing protein [Acidobacteriia bacterium]|nr:twin-arginine translocation signal domain-containing protein [Terriglobia bacterium]